jgi:hypothetical protein
VHRDQRRDCVRRVVAEARSRDAGGAMVAASRSPSMPQ